MRTDGQTPSLTCRRPTRASAGKAAFTLVELLVVMAIASLLTGLLVMGVRGFNGSIGRRNAISTLMGVFDQARTVAISDARPTYVAFVSSPGGQNNSAGVAATMWGRAYAVFEDPVLQDSSTTTSYQPQQRSSWLYLPTGFAFKSNTADGSPESLTSSPPVTNDAKFSVPASGGTVKLSLPYVKFDSSGQIVDHASISPQVLDPGSTLLRILIFEGTANSSGIDVSTRRSAGTTGVNVKYALDEIMLKSTTGRARYTLNSSNNSSASN